jgi:hypothetical protein
VAALTFDAPLKLAQVRSYVKVPAALGVRVCVPLAPSWPLQPPEAVQLLALADDQEIVVELPSVTESAASVSVGAAGTPCVVTINVAVLAIDGPVVLAQMSV